MAIKAKHRNGVVRRPVDDDEEEIEEKPITSKIVIARTVKRSEVPQRTSPGQRNPEYEKLVARLIKLEPREEGVCIAVESKKKKVQVREGVRKPLRVRGYDLTAVTDYDDELGEVLYLYATKRAEETVDDEEEEEPAKLISAEERAGVRRRKRRPVVEEEEEDEDDD